MSAAPIRLGIVGVGKIARDQHLPALAANGDFTLAAAASRHAAVDDVPSFHDIASMIVDGPPLDAVSLCTPPQGRHAIARAAIDAGLHVMLEKPPGATVSEVVELAERARARGVVMFTTWHSREAAAVDPARAWLADRQVKSVRITWKEDVRRWHPGQDWIFEAGGLGVFDPGINALSVVTRILPGALILDSATLDFPANRAAPIAATLALTHDGTAPVVAEFDFLQTGPQSWDVEIETDRGALALSHGGSRMTIDGEAVVTEPDREYPRLYARFADLVARGESDVDVAPLQIAADAFMLGQRRTVDAFDF